MELRTYLRAIRRSWWIVLVVLVAGGLLGYAKAASTTKVYAASVTFYVSTPRLNNETAFGSDQFAQDRANSYAQLLSSDRLARLVIAKAGLAMSPDDLTSAITGSAEVNTVLVKAQIHDSSPKRLRRIADGVASEFPRLVDTIENTGPARTVELNVVSGPSVGGVPISPRTSLYAELGLAAGLILGLLLAALREVVDTSIRTPEELEEVGRAPLLASIVNDVGADRMVSMASGLGRSRRAEDFRQLRTNLEFINTVQRAQVVAVTSAVVGEGKSSTAVNLAVVASERGAKVLLVDADLRRPRVAEALGLEASLGLTTVLTGRVALADVVQEWGQHGLHVLPSGITPPNPSDLLDSEAIRTLVGLWRKEFDLIVLDTPPLLTVTDAVVCGRFVDGVIVVYRYGRTRRAHFLAALRLLRSVDARILGLVLNRRPKRGPDGATYGRFDGYTDEGSRWWPRHHRGAPVDPQPPLPAVLAEEPVVAAPEEPVVEADDASALPPEPDELGEGWAAYRAAAPTDAPPGKTAPPGAANGKRRQRKHT